MWIYLFLFERQHKEGLERWIFDLFSLHWTPRKVGAATGLHTLAYEKCCPSVLDQGSAEDDRLIGQVGCRNYDDVTWSFTIVTENLAFNSNMFRKDAEN